MKTLHTIYTSFAKRLAIILTLLLTLGVTSVWGAEYEEMLVLDVAKNAPTGGTTTAMDADAMLSYLENASETENEIKSVTDVTGNVYKGKGTGGDGIPQACLKIGKAKEGAGFTFTIADSFDNISKVVLVGYGWKSTTAVSVNNLDALVPTEAATEVSFEYILGTPTKTISISVATSAFCATQIILYKEAASKCAYTVTFNSNDGTNATSSQEFTCGETKALTANSFSRTGYTFAGWATSENGSVAYNDQQLVNLSSTSNDNIPLYAQWTPTQYTITYNGLEGATHSNPTNYTIESETITFTAPSERVGYNFIGWNPASITTGSTGNKTITAQWTEKPLTNYRTTCTEPSTFTVTYDENGATSGSVPTGATEYEKDAQVTVLGNTGDLAKIGYTFSGWNTKADGSGNNYAAGATFTITENTTLYAKWTAKIDPAIAWNPTTCTVTIDAGEELPIFQNPNNLTPITFESSNSEVASVDNNGVITLGTTATTAIVTITATFDGDATYAAKEATCTLTVNPSNCRWVETEIGDIDSGDEVVVMMAHGTYLYALPYDEETANNSNPAATSITLDDFEGIIVDELIWFITKDHESNNFTLSPKTAIDKYLTCNKSSNAVRINTGENRNFTIEDDFLKNTNLNTYLAISTAQSKDWRHYESTNKTISSKAQTLKFYKRECYDASKVWVEGNLTNVTCSPQLPQQLAKDGSITLTFTAADGYVLPNDVTVTNATKTWNKADGTLTISDPTDNVMVTVEAVELHTITWMVGSNSVLTEEVANATGVTQTPDNDPANGAIGECANAFMGWTETSLGSAEGQSAPADLCTAAQMKAKHTYVTGDKTF